MMIRTAVSGDASSLASLACRFRDHLQRQAPTDERFRANIEHLLSTPDAVFLLAEDEGVPLGYVLLRFRHSMWADGLEATLEDLFVDPDRRRSGTGRRLVAQALELARARGCVTVCLDTNERNEASTRIYTDLGFDSFSQRWQGRQVFYRLSLREPAALSKSQSRT